MIEATRRPPRVDSFERTTSWNRWDAEAAEAAVAAEHAMTPRRRADSDEEPIVGHHPPWREAVGSGVGRYSARVEK